MGEIKHTLTPTQKNHFKRFKDILHMYYVKGNNSYTTLMGHTIGMQDSISLLDNILYTNYYTNRDRDQLNHIRSMCLSLTDEKTL